MNNLLKEKQGGTKSKKGSESKFQKILDNEIGTGGSNSEVAPIEEKLEKICDSESVNNFEESKKESTTEEKDSKILSSPREQEGEDESI